MSEPVGSRLFEALRVSLADFRGRVEGSEGRRIATIGHTEGTIPNLIRQVLGAIADALAWLGGALRKAADALKLSDAVVALIEVGTSALRAIAEIALDDGPRMLELPTGPLKEIHVAVNTVFTSIEQVAGYIPSPEELAGTREELGLLLGNRVDPALKGPGSLGKLLAEVSVS
jgi:hypothetical protein